MQEVGNARGRRAFSRLVGSWAPSVFILGSACAALLAIALFCVSMGFPASDDFCRAVAHPEGPFAQTALLYQIWTGRWLTSLFFASLTPALDLYGGGYGLALAAAMFVWLAGFRLAAALMLGPESTQRARWALSVLLFALFWAGAPGPSEVFYWLSAAFEYGGSFALAILSLRLLGGVVRPERGLLAAAAAGLVGILAAGAHEFAGAMILGLGMCWMPVLWLLGRRRAAACCLLALVLVAAGLALNQLAPGNAARTGLFPQGGSVERALAFTFVRGDTPLGWLIDVRLWALSFFLLALPSSTLPRPAWGRVPLPILMILPAATVAAVLAGWLLSVWGIGFPPPERLQSLLYAMFVAGWAATLIGLRTRFAAPLEHVTARPVLANIAAAALAATLLLSWNTRAALYDLRYARAYWLEVNQQRLQHIAREARSGQGDVVLSGGWTKPRLFMLARLSDDPDDVRNQCAAKVLGVASIRMARSQSEMIEGWRAK